MMIKMARLPNYSKTEVELKNYHSNRNYPCGNQVMVGTACGLANEVAGCAQVIQHTHGRPWRAATVGPHGQYGDCPGRAAADSVR